METALYFLVAGAVGDYLLFSRRRRERLRREGLRYHFPKYAS